MNDALEWAKTHRLVVGVGALALVLAALYARHRAKTGQSASGTAGLTGSTTTDPTGGQYLVPYDGTADYAGTYGGGYTPPAAGGDTLDLTGLQNSLTGFTTSLDQLNQTLANAATLTNPAPTGGAAGNGGNTGSTASPTMPTTTGTTTAKQPAGYGEHTVTAGETTAGIAAKYGLTVDQLRAYNPQFNFGAPLTAGEIFRVRSAAPVPTEPAGKGLPPATPAAVANTLQPVRTLPIIRPLAA